jgi:hypothetical protein
MSRFPLEKRRMMSDARRMKTKPTTRCLATAALAITLVVCCLAALPALKPAKAKAARINTVKNVVQTITP